MGAAVTSLRERSNCIRFSVADRRGAVSFVGPCHAIKMLVAACARGAKTFDELIALLRGYDEQFATQVANGLAVFDEHNLPGDTGAIERRFADSPPSDWPPFRVYNQATRNASTQPTGAGLIIFNLDAKRIIQVQNSYAEIQRKDRGRRRMSGRPVQQLYYYELPGDWSIVP